MRIVCDTKPQGYRQVIGALLACWAAVCIWGGELWAEAPSLPAQIAPMRQDAIKLPTVPESAPMSSPTMETTAANPVMPLSSQLPLTDGTGTFGYDPSGRRDPFAPIVQELQPGKVDSNLPPLQRVTLTELNLIAVVWGAYGYTAMVQTPEGHGYTVRRGTRIGQNNGVVSAVTERGIIVQERFTDIYGKKQEREYVKLLHPKEGSE